jgi:hypothetical protein
MVDANVLIWVQVCDYSEPFSHDELRSVRLTARVSRKWAEGGPGLGAV